MSRYFDNRWMGPHGIGRFATEVSRRCGFEGLGLGGSALDLVDPWRLRRALLSKHPEHFFSPGFNAPLGKPCSFSLTVHDLIHLDVKEEQSMAKNLYYQTIVLPAMRNAEVVFTVSEYSRKRLASWSGLDPERIVCVGNGVDDSFRPGGEGWAHQRPYLLYVGNNKPHKNVEGLVKAYAISRLSKEMDLLLTGTLNQSTVEMAQRCGVMDKVIGLGLIPEVDLPKLYRGAYALAMPSRYEGFGLPLVEAMASGVPVLSSNCTALPEVGGDAVVYFDPDDLEEFVAGLDTLEDSVRHAQLSAAGLKRAKEFNWNSVAERVSDAIAQRIGSSEA